MVECLTQDLGVAGSSLTGVTRCVIEQDTFKSLHRTGSIQKDPSPHNLKIVDWDVKNQIKQNKQISSGVGL